MSLGFKLIFCLVTRIRSPRKLVSVISQNRSTDICTVCLYRLYKQEVFVCDDSMTLNCLYKCFGAIILNVSSGFFLFPLALLLKLFLEHLQCCLILWCYSITLLCDWISSMKIFRHNLNNWFLVFTVWKVSPIVLKNVYLGGFNICSVSNDMF